MREKYNENWEERMRNQNIPQSTNYVKAKLSMELELYKTSKSSVSDSLQQINNPFEASASDVDRSNTKVRKMEYPGNVPRYQPVNNDYNNNAFNNNQYYGGYVDNSNFQHYSNNSNGNANVLILCSIAALVFLVVLVSLFIMNSIGF